MLDVFVKKLLLLILFVTVSLAGTTQHASKGQLRTAQLSGQASTVRVKRVICAFCSVGFLTLSVAALYCSKRLADGALEASLCLRGYERHAYIPLIPQSRVLFLNALGVAAAGVYAGWKYFDLGRQRENPIKFKDDRDSDLVAIF